MRYARLADNLRKELADVLDKVGRPEAVLMCRRGPWSGLLEERSFHLSCIDTRHTLRTFIVVWLARAEVSMLERVVASLEDAEPHLAAFSCALGKGVWLGQDA